MTEQQYIHWYLLQCLSVYTYMCACMCMCVYVHTHIYTHKHRIYIYLYLCVYICKTLSSYGPFQFQPKTTRFILGFSLICCNFLRQWELCLRSKDLCYLFRYLFQQQHKLFFFTSTPKVSINLIKVLIFKCPNVPRSPPSPLYQIIKTFSNCI